MVNVYHAVPHTEFSGGAFQPYCGLARVVTMEYERHSNTRYALARLRQTCAAGNINFDGTKLPMVVDCLRTTTPSMNLASAFDYQVRSTPHRCANSEIDLRKREETLCQLHPRSLTSSSTGRDLC